MSIGDRVLPQMRDGYRGVCSYATTWIPPSVGNHSVDHCVPKSQNSKAAYESTSSRYVSARFNGRKGVKSILDPFRTAPSMVCAGLQSFLIFPNAMLDDAPSREVADTIGILKLNSDDDLVNERATYFNPYVSGHMTFAHLRGWLPSSLSRLRGRGFCIRRHR